jgi:hypothetical protein
MRTIAAEGNNIRNAVAAAKRLLGNPKLRIVTVNDDCEENNYRVTLTSSDVVEVHVTRHAQCSAEEIS